MESNEVAAQEVVEDEFNRFLDAMDLKDKVDLTKLDDDDAKALKQTKETIFRAMRRGHLVIDEHGRPVFTPQVAPLDKVTFYEPTGADIAQMDMAKKDASVARQNNLLGAITKTGPGRFAKMSQRDYRVCIAIMLLFLA